MRRLVVEDEKKVAELIRCRLQQEGYAIDLGEDGEEGEYLAKNFDYNLLILDLMLPKLPGTGCVAPGAADETEPAGAGTDGAAG